MKTLKDILELYQAKSKDERRFVDKHIVVKQKDRNGNKDNVFQATNIKAVDRKAERHGYEPGEDEEVYEETEHLEEKYYNTPGHLKKQLEDKYGPAHTTIVDADENSGVIKHTKRYLNDDGEDSYETRVHQLVGSGPIKNRTIGKLIRHVGKKRSLKRGK